MERDAVIRRDEYEQLRAAADEDATDVAIIQRILDDPDQTWAPADLVRRIAEGQHPVRVWRTHRGMTARAGRRSGNPEFLSLGHRAGGKTGVGEGAQESRHSP